MKVSEALSKFNDEFLKARLYSSQTEKGYFWVVRSFIECCGDLDTTKLSDRHIVLWVAYMKKKGNTQSTIVSNLSRIKIFVGFLHKYNLSDLSKDAVYVPRKPKTIARHVSKEEVNSMISSCTTLRDKALISFLFSTGIRNAELRNLKRENVTGSSVFIKQGKGHKDRITYMDSRARQLLDTYLLTRVDNDPHLFVSNWGTKIASSTLRYIIVNIGKRVGIELHPHMLRHGLATHLMENGMPSRMIQKILGHSYLSTTEQYLHVDDSKMQQHHLRIMAKEET